jgi:beta-mannosidase
MDTIRKGRRVFLETEAVVENLHPWAEQAGVLEIRIAPPGKGRKAILRRYALALPVGRSAVRDLVEIPDPQLWWPNGMGPQPLYHVTARVLDGRTRCDGREMQVGLRTIRIDRAALADGSRFCFRVNGEKVFCKGADWGPADALLPRVSREKYARLVAEAKGAHFNMFRVNGVGNYEPAAFYDACDRAGILVWQDFNFSCTTYPDHLADFRNGVREEAEQVIAALRHHPCVALWCGANENIWGFEGWWNPQKTQPLHLGGTILYNQVLPDACRRMDPHRAYWPCSPFGGERPNGEDAGDCHWWTFMKSDPDQWISHEIYDQCKARFVSEFGAIGPCHMDSIRQYLRPADRRLDCLAWRRHTNQCEQGKTGRGIAFHYVQPDGLSLADYVLYGQMFQAQLLGRAVEALRFRKNDPDADCQGALVWSYSEPWGETGWSLIDYYCRRKASYYWYRRACKPVKVIVRRRGDSLVTRLINDRLAPVEGVVEVGWFRVDGTRRRTRQVAVVAGANSAVHVAAERIPGPDLCDPRQWLYAAVFRGGAAGADDDQCIWPLAPHRQLQSVKPAIQATPAPGGWIVTGNVYCPGVHFNDHGRAVLSDNYFDLLPGVPYRIARVDGGNGLPKMHAIPPGTG